MKLVTFHSDGKSRAGVVAGDGVIDLSARLGVASLKQLIQENRIAEAESITDVDYARADVRLDLPIPDPAKILCVGVNYVNRNEEYKDGSEAPAYPSLFLRTPLSFVAHGQPL